MTDNILSVCQLNEYTCNLLKGDFILNNLFVMGEISNLNIHYSGHIYFTFKDESASIKAVMFKSYAEKLKFTPKNGITLLAAGKVSLYVKDGTYQFYVTQIIPQGAGALNLAYEQLLDKLQSKGLFDEAHKLPLPKFPSRIAVVTSPTGAAVQDVLNVIRRRYPICDIIMCPVKVQGQGAAKEIINTLKTINAKQCADVIILCRGGGSIEELWEFNNEQLAVAIYESSIPIISGVGHETDFTICDYAADLRAPTPSAAAELATPDILEFRKTLDTYEKIITREIDERLFKLKSRYAHCISSYIFVDFSKIANHKRARLAHLKQDMDKLILNKLQQLSQEKTNLFKRLNDLSTSSIISRGFTIIKKDNEYIKSVNNLKAGDEITILLSDGNKSAIIK